MATEQEYRAGVVAAERVINADIDHDVPVFFRDDISAQMVARIATDVARAVIDAVDAVRAQQKPHPKAQG